MLLLSLHGVARHIVFGASPCEGVPVQSLSQKLKVAPENVGLLSIMYFAFFCSGMMSTLLGAILPSMKVEYEMSYVLSGMVLSAHQIGNFCAVLIAGFLPYVIGRKKSTLLLCSGIVIGLMLMTLTGNPALLLVAFAATGIGRGTMSNITNVVVSEVAENKAGGLNFLHASFAVGAFISPFIAILITSLLGLSWKLAALIVAACEIVALAGIGFSRLANKPMPRKSDGGRDFVRSWSFWLNTFIMFFYLCAEASIIGWLVTYFKDSGIMSTSLAQSTSSLLWIMVMVGRITCASISNKVDKNKLILGLGLSMTFFFILMISTRSIMVIFPSLLGVGVSMSGIYPTTLSTMDRRFNSSTVATGTCIATATVGAILMPMVVGAVAERQGIAGGIGSISIALGVMVVLMVVKVVFGRKQAR